MQQCNVAKSHFVPAPRALVGDALLLQIYVDWLIDHYQVLTKDSVTVSVDAVVYYRVSNATVSVANVENAHHSTRLLAQTTLRNVLGTKNLSEILSEREAISNMMQVHKIVVDFAFSCTQLCAKCAPLNAFVKSDLCS